MPQTIQIQADWLQQDSTQIDYIKNKPTFYAEWWGTQVEYDAILVKDPTVIYNIITPTQLRNYFYVEDASGSDNTLSIVKGDSNCPSIEVFYSTNQQTWVSMGSTDTTAITATVPANGKLYLKCTTNRWGNEMYNGNKITCSATYNVGGNIMSLLNSDNFENTSFISDVSREFQFLFYNSTTLVNAKDIVFPNNADYGCYRSMFNGCTSLVSVSAYSTSYKSNAFVDWLNNVAASGDFYNLGGATYPSGGSGIPTGWTEHNSL